MKRDPNNYAQIDKAAVIEDLWANTPYDEIIRKHGIVGHGRGPKYWIAEVRRAAGIPARLSDLPPWEERKAKALEMIEDGASLSEIERTARINRATIKRRLGYQGWEPDQIIQHALAVRHANAKLNKVWAEKGIDIRRSRA